MSKLFFNKTESKYHYEMKEKLFNLIIENKVKIKDQNGIEYPVFQKIHSDEFLHIESFILKPNNDENTYMNSVFFSNKELPCVKYFNFNNKQKNVLCDLKGTCGAFEKLPCYKCLEINLTDEEKKNISIGFSPDIAFGYGGKHIIWLEVLNTSPCSESKIAYCKKNNIELLEIDAHIIDKFFDEEMYFTNLTNDKWLEEKKLMEQEILICNLLVCINKDGYFPMKEFKEKYRELMSPIYTDDFNQLYNKFLDDHEFYEIRSCDYNEYVKYTLNIKIEGLVHLLVDKEFKTKIEEVFYYSKSLTLEETMAVVDWIVDDMKSQIDKNGLVTKKGFFNRIIKELRKAKFTEKECLEEWNKILLKHNLFEDDSISRHKYFTNITKLKE